jgi:hypothetical protein
MTSVLTRLRQKPEDRRGGLMFEFALLLPLVVFLIGFTIDMGRLVSVSTTLHDATSVAARAGARQGYAGTVPAGTPCPKTGVSTTGVNPSYEAFCEAFLDIPGTDLVSVRVETPRGISGECVRGIGESGLYVRVYAKAHLDYITPGMETIVAAAKGGRDIASRGVARCEVAR